MHSTDQFNYHQPFGQHQSLHPDLRRHQNVTIRVRKVFGSAKIVRLGDSDYAKILYCFPLMRQYALPGDIITVPCNSKTNLCAICFAGPHIDDLKRFLEANPWIRKTKWTVSFGYYFVWLNIIGWRPNNFFNLIHWFSDFLVPVVNTSAPDEQFLVEGSGSQIIPVKIEDIVWPEIQYRTFMLEYLESQWGSLFSMDGFKITSVNARVAAEFIATAFSLKYETQTGNFSGKLWSQEVGSIPMLKIQREIQMLLHFEGRSLEHCYQNDVAMNSISLELQEICKSKTYKEHGFKLRPIRTR